MPTLKLTKNAIAALTPVPGKQTLYWDTELKGLGVLVSGKTTAKTFVVQHKLADGRTRRVTIGPVGVIDLEGKDGARARARKVLADFYAGVDPKAEARRARKAATLREVLDQYLEARRDLRESTRYGYRATAEKYLVPFLDRRLREITLEEVEALHREIARGVTRRQPEW